MIWYIYYRYREGVSVVRTNKKTQDDAMAAAWREICELPGAKLLYALPNAEVCPECYHRWSEHTNHCHHVSLLLVDGVERGRPCPCRKRSPHFVPPVQLALLESNDAAAPIPA